MLQAMCLRPDILRAFAGFSGAVYPGGILERRVVELVIITASQANMLNRFDNALDVRSSGEHAILASAGSAALPA